MSLIILLIGFLHAIRVAFAAIIDGSTAKLLAAIVMSGVAFFIGSEQYAVVDLVFVWLAFFFIPCARKSKHYASPAKNTDLAPTYSRPQPPVTGSAWRLEEGENGPHWVTVDLNSKTKTIFDWESISIAGIVIAAFFIYRSFTTPTTAPQVSPKQVITQQAPKKLPTNTAMAHTLVNQTASHMEKNKSANHNPQRDLRHCLTLSNNEAISRCAAEK